MRRLSAFRGPLLIVAGVAIIALALTTLVALTTEQAVPTAQILPGQVRPEKGVPERAALQSAKLARSAVPPESLQDPVWAIAVGDLVCQPPATVTSTKCRDADTAKLTAGIDPQLVLSLGDQQYESGAYDAFLNGYDKTWGRFNPITRPVPGNHEYGTSGAAGYYKYFAGQQPGPPGYYAFDTGSWRIYALNSNCTKMDCAKELGWFKTDLAKHPRKCTMMTMHHPRYSSGEHGSSTVMRPFWRVAYANRVDVALAGHDHSYERFRKMDGDGNYRTKGITSFVSGLGGKNLYPMERKRAGSMYFSAKMGGVLKLKLDQGKWAFSLRTVDGRIPDNGSRYCV